MHEKMVLILVHGWMDLKCTLDAEIDKMRNILTNFLTDNSAQLNSTNKANCLKLNEATTDELLVRLQLLY
jgi:hypothetical protein